MEFSSQPENWEYAVGLYAKQCAKDVDACMVETNDATWFSATILELVWKMEQFPLLSETAADVHRQR